MENNRENIKCNQVLFNNELIQYLKIIELKELSLTNKYFRSKLNPLLFKSICLNKEKLSDYFDYSKVSNKLRYDIEQIKSHSYHRYSGDKHLALKDVEHNPIIKTLESSLASIKQHVKSFKLYKLNELGYFAFRLSCRFDNLEKLDIYECCIPLIGLAKLGKGLKNLKSLSLYGIDLIVGYKMELSIDMVNLPINLKDFSISNSGMYIFRFVTSKEDMIYFKSNSFKMVPLIFNISSLTKFYIDNCNGERQLVRFLKLNPQLKSLELESGNISQNLLNYIANGSSNLSNLCIKRYIFHMNDLFVPTFNFITDLKLGQFHLNHTLAANICLNCPNLINLTIILTHGDIINQFNIMLEYIAQSFKILKKFELIVKGAYIRAFKFRCLTTIQTLVVRNYKKSAMNLQSKHLPSQFLYLRDICIPSGKAIVLNK
jgi:hypothetical protein